MGEMAGEPLKQQIAKFDAACAITVNQWKITYNCHLWLDDSQASSFLYSGPLEVPFGQPITKVWVAIERLHEINVERVGQFISKWFFETLDHIELQFVIEPLRSCLFLELVNSNIKHSFPPTKAMPLVHQQLMSVGHYEKERSESIAVRTSLF